MKIFPKTYTAKQHIYYCQNEMSFYIDYIKRFELFIEEESIKYKEYLSSPDKFIEYGERYNHKFNHSNNLESEFPNLLRASTFIRLWSYFENSLNKLCEVYEFHKSLDIGFADMKNKGIDRAKLYLSKIVHLKFPTNLNWDKIKKLQRIRNNVIHSYSKFRDDNTQLLSDVKSFKFLKLYPLNSESLIQIDEFFLDSVIKTFEDFYIELLQSINTMEKPNEK